MRSISHITYVILGLTLGVVMYLLWRGCWKDHVARERFAPATNSNDPPTAPCNVDFASLVQDQFLAENANRGSNTCVHQYPDPTVFSDEIRLQQPPNKFMFCTTKNASQKDVCPTHCKDGCVSLQSEADDITNATRKKTQEFKNSLDKFENNRFGPMRDLFDGVTPPAQGLQTQGVYPTLKAELARRERLIDEMNNLKTDIQTAADAVTNVKTHVAAQKVCKTTHTDTYAKIAANTETVKGLNPEPIPGGGGGSGYACYGKRKAVLYEIPSEDCDVCGKDADDNWCSKMNPQYISPDQINKNNYKISQKQFTKSLCDSTSNNTRIHNIPYAIQDDAQILVQ